MKVYDVGDAHQYQDEHLFADTLEANCRRQIPVDNGTRYDKGLPSGSLPLPHQAEPPERLRWPQFLQRRTDQRCAA